MLSGFQCSGKGSLPLPDCNQSATHHQTHFQSSRQLKPAELPGRVPACPARTQAVSNPKSQPPVPSSLLPTQEHQNGPPGHTEAPRPARSRQDRKGGSRPGFLPLLRVPVMSFKMVWANFTNPSLHLLEQPLMVAEGRQALLSVPRKEGFLSACPWHLEPAWTNPERGTHHGSSWHNTAASAGSLASASREPAGHAVCSLPLSFPPLRSYPQEDLGMPGLGQRCQGTGRSEGARRSMQRSGAGGELELSQALLAVFLPGGSNVAINTPVRREGTAVPKHSVPQLPGWPSCLLLPA